VDKKGAPRVDLSAITAYFARQPDVVAAYLFGSVAEERADGLSDVDIAVLLGPAPGARELVERQLELIGALETYADREVQVTILNRASPALTFQVVQHGKLLYERGRPERIEFEIRARKIYFDIRPMLEFFDQVVAQRIREMNDGPASRPARRSRALEAAERVHQRLARASRR